MTNKQPFINETSQADRRQVHKDTMHTRAIGNASMPRDRWSGINKTTVTGASPIQYPEQPPNSHWARDPVPAEPPLGYSVDDHPPVGEVFEVERSLGDQSADLPSADREGGVAATEIKQDLGCSTAQSQVAPPPSPNKKSED
jgi:hypothetical protein